MDIRFGLIVNLMVLTLVTAQDTHHSNDTSWKFDLTDCGTQKSCWFMPGECNTATGNDRYTKCHSIFTWRLQKRADGKRDLIIEMDTRTDDMGNAYMGKYASVGFSDDYVMGEDFVIECVAIPSGRVRAYLSFNDGVANIRSKESSKILLNNTHGTSNNGRLSCQTTYAMDDAKTAHIPEDEKWRIMDITDRPFYLMFVRGDADPENDALHIHWLNDGDRFPWIATQKNDMTNFAYVTRTAAKHYDIPRSIQYQLVQAHGILMIFGWWVFAAVAMFLSRYFKPAWPDTKLCGQAVWFQLHRALLIISLILQCSSFALIFIQSGTLFTCNRTCDDHSYSLMLHTYLGIACTAAALIQPFMALARPGPASPKRPFFNWLHWFFGTGSFILATVTIFLSAVLGKAGLRRVFGYKADYVMAGYVVAFIVCSLLLEMIWYCRYRTEIKGPIQMSTMGPRAPPPTKSSESSRSSFGGLQTGVLAFFVIASLALCAALSYFIGSIQH